jgi:hypothetical protein
LATRLSAICFDRSQSRLPPKVNRGLSQPKGHERSNF